ncbi:MAG: tetratricopeptide repeat protein [Myxococcales bacterium]|nr:tetratricopeptide repeat protein [Myxococcales bacterium]
MSRLASRILLFGLALAATAPARAGRPWEVNRSPPALELVDPTAGTPVEEEVACREVLDRGREYLRQGRYDKARQELTEAVVRCPTHLEARLLRARATLVIGFLAWRRDLVEECAGDVALARSLDPENREALDLHSLLDGLLRRMAPTSP